MKLWIEIAAFGLLLAWGLRRWWLWYRWQQVRKELDAHVSHDWTRDRRYSRDGDDRQSK
jgi:hypothetical protein